MKTCPDCGHGLHSPIACVAKITPRSTPTNEDTEPYSCDCLDPRGLEANLMVSRTRTGTQFDADKAKEEF